MATAGLTSIIEVLRTAAGDIQRSGRGLALVGGLAVSARTEPRFTRDVDLAVAVEGDSDAENLLRLLQARRWRLTRILEQEATGRVASARIEHPDANPPVVVDLLFASCGIEPEVVAAASSLEIVPGLTLPVAEVGDLLAMKVLSRDDEKRPQDLLDLRALLGVASEADLERARDRAKTIDARGFGRGRNVEADLAALLGGRG